jgi:hypothetical protein
MQNYLAFEAAAIKPGGACGYFAFMISKKKDDRQASEKAKLFYTLEKICRRQLKRENQNNFLFTC